MSPKLCTAMFLSVAAATRAPAGIICVPDDVATIQAAIAGADPGDEIVVAPGVYPEALDLLGKAITVRSTDPADADVVAATVLDGGGLFTIITCTGGEGRDTLIAGFTITGGEGTSSGTGLSAGGIYINSSHPTISRCVFTGNNAFFKGGGILVELASPMVVDCTFAENEADNGGGIAARFNSSPSVIDCVFEDNTAHVTGGGMFNSIGQPVVTGCTFRGNNASRQGGGGIYNGGSNPTVTASLFCNNAPDDILGGYTDGGGNSFAAKCPVCRADTNDDGNVDVLDLVNVTVAWGTDDPATDVNGDGIVNVLDLVAVTVAWGPCS